MVDRNTLGHRARSDTQGAEFPLTGEVMPPYYTVFQNS